MICPDKLLHSRGRGSSTAFFAMSVAGILHEQLVQTTSEKPDDRMSLTPSKEVHESGEAICFARPPCPEDIVMNPLGNSFAVSKSSQNGKQTSSPHGRLPTKSVVIHDERYLPPPVSNFRFRRVGKVLALVFRLNSRTSGNDSGGFASSCHAGCTPFRRSSIVDPVRYQRSPTRMSLTVRSKPWLELTDRVIGVVEASNGGKSTDHC